MTGREGLHFQSGIAARILLASLVVSTAVVVAAVPAHAACSSPVDQIDAAARAGSVFVGLVIDVSDSSRKATIQVLETWKGPDLPAEVSVNGSFAGAPAIGPNDRTFNLGATYLVIPFGSRPPFFDEACSGTGLYVPAGGVIPARFHDAVGATTARLPDVLGAGDETTVGGGPTRLVIGGGVAGLFLLLLLARWRRKRKSVPSPVAGSRTHPAPRAKKRPVPSTSGPLAGPPTGFTVPARKKRRRRRSGSPMVDEQAKGKRFQKSGLSDLEAMRRKTRRVKGKKARSQSQ